MSSADTKEVAPTQQRKQCVSCGIISGCGLNAAGLYVYWHARKFVSASHTPGWVPLSFIFSLGLVGLGWTLIFEQLPKPVTKK